MGKLPRAASLAVLWLAVSSGASAEVSRFAVSPVSAPSTAFNFSLPTDPAPALSAAGDFFTLENVAICDFQLTACDYPATSDLTFYTAGSGGGLSRTGGYFDGVRYFGDVLFTGSVSSPSFLSGIFSETDNVLGSTTDLVITGGSSVPEPLAWAEMVLGFAVVGASLRHGSFRVRLKS